MSKILVVLPDNIYYRNYDMPYFVLDAITSGKLIPDNATNGDIIKVIFPDSKDWKAKIEDNNGEVYEVHFVELPNSMTINKYEESWWNAPYKAESEGK